MRGDPMLKKLFAFVTVGALALGAGSTVFADEKPVKEADVPKPVIDAVKKEHPNASLKRFAQETEKGEVAYEVTLEDGKRRIEMLLSPAGKILEEEETVALEAVPEAVKKALAASKYAKATVKRVEKVVKEQKEDTTCFEFLLTEGDMRYEVVFDRGGKIVEEESKKVGKDDDDEDDEDEDD